MENQHRHCTAGFERVVITLIDPCDASAQDNDDDDDDEENESPKCEY